MIHVNNLTDPKATKFLNILDSLELSQLITGPTHDCGDTLDLVISRGITITDLVVSDINVSDHYRVSFNVSLNTIRNHSEAIIKRRLLDTTAELRFFELTNSIDQNIFNYPID